MDLKKIQSNAGGQTPSTGQELVDAFNENFELVDKNKADKDLSNVSEEDLVKVLYGPDYDSSTEAFREFITTVPESLKVIDKLAILLLQAFIGSLCHQMPIDIMHLAMITWSVFVRKYHIFRQLYCHR